MGFKLLLVCSSSCQLVQYPGRKAADPCTAHTAAYESPRDPEETPSLEKGCQATYNKT